MLESSVLNDEKIFDRIELLFGEIFERRERKKVFLRLYGRPKKLQFTIKFLALRQSA